MPFAKKKNELSMMATQGTTTSILPFHIALVAAVAAIITAITPAITTGKA